MSHFEFGSYYELIYDSGRHPVIYDSCTEKDGKAVYIASFEAGGYSFSITDTFVSEGKKKKIERRIHGEAIEETCSNGIRFLLSLPVETDKNCRWRFCSPSLDFTKPRRMIYRKSVSYQDRDTAGSMFGAYNCDKHIMISIYRTSEGTGIDSRRTIADETKARADMASLGYEITGKDELSFMMRWPLTSAYYLMGGADVDIALNYATSADTAPTFADGMYEIYRQLVYNVFDFDKKRMKEQLLKSIDSSKRKFEMLYSASDCMESFSGESDMIRFGLTERNIRIALFMAAMCGGEWMNVCERMTDRFVAECIASDGFIYTVYDRKNKTACTDADGNYLRAMTEAAYDVLCAYRMFRKHGINKPSWLEKDRRFMDFLIRVQNVDGSWFQAYHEDGSEAEVRPVHRHRMEVVEGMKKAGTAVPLAFTAQMVRMLEGMGLHADDYRQCVLKCADYVLKNNIRFESYMGGDPTHPDELAANAARYSMMGLYDTHLIFNDKKYLDGAVTAAKMFMIWNADYPCHCIELYRLGKETGEMLFCQMTDFMNMDMDVDKESL